MGDDYGMVPLVDNSWDTPRTVATVSADIAGQRQGVDTSGFGQWTGFFQNVGTGLLNYAIARDAAQQNLEATRMRLNSYAMQPVYSTAGGAFSVSPTLLLIVGVVAAVVLLKD